LFTIPVAYLHLTSLYSSCHKIMCIQEAIRG